MKRICKDCKKEEEVQKNAKSEYCRECQFKRARKKTLDKKRKEHKCYDCGTEVKPVTYIPGRCTECRKKDRERRCQR